MNDFFPSRPNLFGIQLGFENNLWGGRNSNNGQTEVGANHFPNVCETQGYLD
jgi:hypothetical protein